MARPASRATCLSVHDNFDRALGNVTDAVRGAAPGLIEGIELTQREL